MSTSEPGEAKSEDREIMHSMCADRCGPDCTIPEDPFVAKALEAGLKANRTQTFLDPEGHPMKWMPELLTHTHEDGSPICELKPFSLGPGESREIAVLFRPEPVPLERIRIIEPKEVPDQEFGPVWVEPSVTIGDRANRFPWGITFWAVFLTGLAIWGIYFAVLRVLAL